MLSDHDIARLFCVGFTGLVPSPEIRHLIARGVSSVIFFKRNIESPAQFAQLTTQLKQLAGRPLLTCIDQEGGRVARLRDGFTAIASMREIGRTGDPRFAAAAGRVLGAELRAVNIDLNFAPVLDVDTNPMNPVIADRSFGADPVLVSRMAEALLLAMQAQGVAACGKHFPGHGDTSQDSHLHLPVLPHGMDRLMRIELPPFFAAARAGIASMMTAHVIFPAIDRGVPSTMSPPVVTGLLRDKIGFDGIIFSDDLEMKAIAEHFSFEDAVIRAINAGVDQVMICHSPDLQNRAIDIAAAAARDGRIPPERIAAAHRRLDRLFTEFVKPPLPAEEALAILNCELHRRMVRPPDLSGSDVARPHGKDPTEWRVE